MYQCNVSSVRSIPEVFPTRLCGVLRTDNAEVGFQACLAALEAGVGAIEITKTVPPCFELIRGLVAPTRNRYPIGGGTLLGPRAVEGGKQTRGPGAVPSRGARQRQHGGRAPERRSGGAGGGRGSGYLAAPPAATRPPPHEWGGGDPAERRQGGAGGGGGSGYLTVSTRRGSCTSWR